MSDKENRTSGIDKKEMTEKNEEKRGFRVLSQVIALIVCLLISFSVWLVVHYRQDKKNDPPANGGEASYAYQTDTAGL
ncbi:MAG: hypothetical protein IKX66_04750 [Clostridia bacterium]|nr:hypothetical protein [Clostridia bacterium]